MKRILKKSLILGGVALVATAGYATVAAAQSQSTPKGWNWELKGNKERVQKPTNVSTSADGSKREETRVGKCVKIKVTLANGDVRKWDECEPS